MDDIEIELQKLVKDAYAAVQKAQEYAEEHGKSFNFSLAYGMGGTFYPITPEGREKMIQNGEHWLPSVDETEEGWMASSNSC